MFSWTAKHLYSTWTRGRNLFLFTWFPTVPWNSENYLGHIWLWCWLNICSVQIYRISILSLNILRYDDHNHPCRDRTHTQIWFNFMCFLLAWQQHDIQELCRVMFDALEQKWKQTEQVGESIIYETSWQETGGRWTVSSNNQMCGRCEMPQDAPGLAAPHLRR